MKTKTLTILLPIMIAVIISCFKSKSDIALSIPVNPSPWMSGPERSMMRVLQGMTTTNAKIDSAANTNKALCRQLTTAWASKPVYWIQVDDAVNSGLFPLLIQRIMDNP